MVVIYCWLFYQVKLYCDMLLQSILAVLQLYGWCKWTRDGQQHQGRHISSLSMLGVVLSPVIGAVSSAALGYLMATYTDAAQTWLDAGLSVFSLVAPVWMAQIRIEN
jgi:nicotinamide mononucleotide transporter